MRNILFGILAATPAVAGAQTYYVDVHNTAPSSLVSLAVAPAGSGSFRSLVIADRPVRGGGDSAMVAFDKNDGGCLRDLRFTFADGRVLLHKDFNVCKYSSYHTGWYWHFPR